MPLRPLRSFLLTAVAIAGAMLQGLGEFIALQRAARRRAS
jgi:hypothetical protein